MIELRLEGLPGDVNAAHDRLASGFDILSVSKVYPNRAPSQLVRQYVKVELKPAPELDNRALTDVIKAMLIDNHNALQKAINITPEMEAYHVGYQNALMELATACKAIPIDDEPTPKPKRKPGRKKQQQQGFWLETEAGPVHVLGNPDRANDPEFRAAVEVMAKAAKEEAERFNG